MPSTPLFRAAALRRIEATAADQPLMQRAGRAAADLASFICPRRDAPILVLAGPETPIWLILLGLAVLGLGYGLFSSPNTNAIMSAVEKRYYGVASGIVGTMRLFGQMLSMGIATMIFAVVIGKVEITPEYYPAFITSVHYAFILFTGLCIVGIYASLIRTERKRPENGTGP